MFIKIDPTERKYFAQNIWVFCVCLMMLDLFFSGLYAQRPELTWSTVQVYDNKMDGFFSNYLGGNDKYIYVKYDNRQAAERRAKIKFISYDVETMEKVNDILVLDRKEVEKYSNYFGLSYYKTLVFNDALYTFWIKEDKEKDELFVQSFSTNLKPIGKLRKIYELISGKRTTKKAELFVLANPDKSSKIIVGGELSGERDQNVLMEYKVMNPDFTFSSSGQITLPVVISGKTESLNSSYSFGEDGNIHIESKVSVPKEERKLLQKNESKVYTIYSIVDVDNHSIKSYPLKFDNKNIFDVGVVSHKGVIKIFGFFCDILKDPQGVDTHGIFYSEINPSTKDLEKLQFTNFTKQQLDALFARDIEDRRDQTGIFTGNKKVNSEEESLGSNYQIEQVKSFDEQYLTIFCTLVNNFSRTYCDQRGFCRTYYYCNKRNVTAFKIDNNGGIVWASNLDRDITYDEWNIKDLNVICPDKERFYVTYGSTFSKDAKRKNSFNRKTGKHMRDFFEYAVFDYNTGQFSKEEYEINPTGTKNTERKLIDATRVDVIREKFYFNSEKLTTKPANLVGGCLLSIACFPIGLSMLNNSNSKRGTGHLGVMRFQK